MKNKMKKKALWISTLVILFGVLQILFTTGLLDAYFQRILIMTGINILLASGLNLIIGFTGQLALGHAAFMAIGAYGSAVLSVKTGTPFPLALIAGTVMGGAAAFLIGYPILRLKGDYLAICTLGFGEIVKVAIQNIEAVGAARGFSGIPPYTTFPWVFFTVVIIYILLKRVADSSYGRTMKAVSEDEIAAEAMGNKAFDYKMLGFVMGSAVAALAGGLYAHYLMFIDPVSFNFSKSTEILTFVVLGGIGSLPGAVAGASILTILPESLRGLGDVVKDYRMLIYAVIIVILMVFRPQGIMGKKGGGVHGDAKSKRFGNQLRRIGRGK